MSFKQSATILQHKVTAFLVEPATAENLAEGILSVLDQPALAHKLRTNVQSFVTGRLKLISDKLKELMDPRTNEPVIKRALRREEIFQGPYVNEAPDLILDWWERSHFSTSHSFPEDMLQPAVEIRERRPSTRAEWGGTHRRDGVLIAHGKSFRKGAEIQGARLIDMAPTILYLMGQPVPEDMDGRVLEELFEPAFIAANRVQVGGSAGLDAEQGAQYSDEEAAIVEERLKALGYIE